MQPSLPNENLRVVVPIVAGIGNALMAVPMVRQIKRNIPLARVAILAHTSAMAEPFRRLPDVTEVLVTGSGIKGSLRKLYWSRRARADVYLVPFPSNRWQYNLLARLSGAHRRIMHAFPIAKFRALGFLRADRVDAVRGIHDVEQNLRLLASLGIEPDMAEAPQFIVNEDDRTRAGQLLRDAGIDDHDDFIAVHAGSAQTILSQAKRWPTAKYAELIGMLAREFDGHFVLIEGPDEQGVSDEIIHALAQQNTAFQRVSSLRLTGPLGDAAAILERAGLYVGSDSGLAHLAAAVGTKPVTIFAPADPQRVSPFGHRDLVVQVSKSCAPCFQYPWNTPYPKMLCREPFCVAEVTVDAVIQTVRRALATHIQLPLAASSTQRRLR